jgi:hypothetical protein
MAEANDFTPARARGQLNLDVALIAARHRTPALTSAEASGCTPTEAARRYYAFAQQRLVASAGGSPIAAHAFYGMGKLYANLSESDSAARRPYDPRSMLLQQTALLIDNSHSLAALELGVLLARAGRLTEARDVLQPGAARQSLPATWLQLAHVHDQLGETEFANQARVEWNRLAQSSGRGAPATVTAPNGMTVRWVDKATFEREGGDLNSTPGLVPRTASQLPPPQNARR